MIMHLCGEDIKSHDCSFHLTFFVACTLCRAQKKKKSKSKNEFSGFYFINEKIVLLKIMIEKIKFVLFENLPLNSI